MASPNFYRDYAYQCKLCVFHTSNFVEYGQHIEWHMAKAMQPFVKRAEGEGKQ